MTRSSRYSEPDGIIYLSDADTILRQLEPGSVDMIYMDPPFFSNRILTRPVHGRQGAASFNDQWDSMATYISWLGRFLRLSHRALSDTGSIFVHLDWPACILISTNTNCLRL